MTTRLPSLLVTLGAAIDSPESDGELLGRFLADRDDAAFASLVRRYARLVWRVARTRCRTDATAEDVFQATFVVLARKAESIRTAGALPGWLHRTAHRLAVKATRSDRPSSPPPTDTPVLADPLDALSARELLAAVDDELAKLSDAERSVLVLCGVENLSLDEAATRLGWTRNSAKGRLERARAKLRTRLDARGLTLPTVTLPLVGGPPAETVQAATLTAMRGSGSPAVEQLISEGKRMTRPFMTIGIVGVLATGLGGFGLGLFQRVGTPVAVAAPVPKAVKRESLDGTWELVSTDIHGRPRAERGQVWVIDGESVIMKANGQASDSTTTDLVRPKGGAADALDLIIKVHGKVVYTDRGLYTLAGDTLTLCTAPSNTDRPTDMKPGQGRAVYTLKRVQNK